MLANIFAKLFDAFDFLWIVFLKVLVILVCRFGESDIHDLEIETDNFSFLRLLQGAHEVLPIFPGREEIRGLL